jgi:hypothetical protein
LISTDFAESPGWGNKQILGRQGGYLPISTKPYNGLGLVSTIFNFYKMVRKGIRALVSKWFSHAACAEGEAKDW